MAVTTDPVALNQWVPCGWPGKVPVGGHWDTVIFGQAIRVTRSQTDTYQAVTLDNNGDPARELPVQDRFCCIFTTLGEDPRPLPVISEFDEPDRRLINCGCVGVNTSPFRIIENFLDMAHFPFVHTDVLGAQERTEVVPYKIEHRQDVDEIWATDCQFFQPAASNAATDGQMTDYVYRIMSPFSIMLYKNVHADPSRNDAICLFIQPREEANCLAYMPMALVDEISTTPAIIDFQQTIFLQDRVILENQRPALMPLAPAAEIPSKADVGSITFRRWLGQMGISFGIYEKEAA